MAKAKPDIKFESGMCSIVQPLTPAGWEWAKTKLIFEDYQLVGGGIAVEPRMIDDLKLHAIDHGLNVE